MADSDSDDELMRALRGGGMKTADCSYCQADGATLPCSKCHQAMYCDDACLRRHFKAHRDHCIQVYLKEESEDEEESEEEEDNDDEEEKANAASFVKRQSSRSFSGPAVMGIPGLTEEQVATLIKLSTKSTDVGKQQKEISHLKTQIEEMLKSQESIAQIAKANQIKPEHVLSKSSSIKQKELDLLMHKLEALEQRASFAPAMLGAPMPLAIAPYFKLQAMSMPSDQIKAKMEVDGVDPGLLDTPHAVSPNDPGAPPGAYVPLTVGNDPKFKKFFKLLAMHMPVDQIKMKMEAEQLDPSLLDHPEAVSPNDPGPPTMMAPSPPMTPPMQPAAPPYVPLLVKDDPAFKKFFKLLTMGMPKEQAQLKMKAEGLDGALLETPDAISPNDPGPPPAPSRGSFSMPASAGGISMDQLFAMVMQHQQMIQQGNFAASGSRTPAHEGGGGGAPVRSVKDQMAAELAAASSAVDDIFGEDTVKATGGGMSMVEQLEKKARKESNKKLVDNIAAINATIHELVTIKFKDEAHAIAYSTDVSNKLEGYGLALGADANQTWSARLLIKNKDTRDWYYSEAERLAAGHAYLRLWYLQALSTDIVQLRSKTDQITNAPGVIQSKNKVDVIDKFTTLLKEAVKLKHKIFKNSAFNDQVAQMATLKIPQAYDAHGQALTDAAAMLANAALDMADDELRVLERTQRAKKIRASTAVHVGEKTVQFVGIVKKLGVSPNLLAPAADRVAGLEAAVAAIKTEYFAEKEEEEEDDVL
ncbi:hypothetical protein SPRG_10700 [Saprolegnia parasitica CBS 223.65]|uniref:MYND-type domain-containing protein n=1 Tax=Saprolegnia parasitica (strain CBS 223.65) TaxID=695850 RepID=A0A067BZN6_SAPPC|nr:hypothetical protein SPRG_10700 [Saprolegnia parasitica CBS 223.65]KDO24004.1 hypothetical protein SPRG_10700 [Saprolegnia parasitica CBS 223.65]|eukprot:XP_012205323.1 hypothetical protein SPRG_10700 [Saprolegnia parasitica CBS 223.65]